MNKKVIIILLVISLLAGYIFNVKRDINNYINTTSDHMSSAILNIFLKTELIISKYFDQLDYIESLKYQTIQNEKYKILYNVKTAKFNELNKYKDSNNSENIHLSKVSILSYIDINNNTKVVLDSDGLISNKIYGLITYDGFSAGIALSKENQTIGYLNTNARANYTVYIGQNNAPAITSGINKGGYLQLEHIPLWKEVLINDKVVTSGMDKIFPFGIKVGRVTEVIKNDKTQTVMIKPYADIVSQRALFIYLNQ